MFIIVVMKTVVRFFRQRAVKGFLKRKKPCVLPDISKYPAMAVLLDKDRFNRRAEIEKTLTRVFVMKNYVFIVFADSIQTDVKQDEHCFFVEKKDFNFWGLLRKEKKEALLTMPFDMVVDFSAADELMTNYIMSLINSRFRVTFGKSCLAMYDLVIDSKKDDDMPNQLEILHKYVSMLLGKR